ncbi:hypothetical protein TNCV_878501 [Trichonephila clavipes]|nr:hypothetical protein TNCV_878501 [Trichonephila clavipes]
MYHHVILSLGKSTTEEVSKKKVSHPKNHTTALSIGIKANHPRLSDGCSGQRADKPQTLDHLADNIRRVIADIRPQMLEKVIENWTSRLDYIRASRGSPVPEIIFKM